MHQTIKKVSNDFESLKFNTAIAAMMSLVNDFYRAGKVTRGEFATLLLLLDPVAPHLCEELWSVHFGDSRVYRQKWPQYDEAKTVEQTVEIALQVNGKMRGTLTVAKDAPKEEVLAAAKEALAARLEGLSVVKEIYIPGRIVNIVVR